MTQPMIRYGTLSVAPQLEAFIREQAAPGTGVAPETFWSVMQGLVDKFAGKNRELLAKRDQLQSRLDGWHRARPCVRTADGPQRPGPRHPRRPR